MLFNLCFVLYFVCPPPPPPVFFGIFHPFANWLFPYCNGLLCGYHHQGSWLPPSTSNGWQSSCQGSAEECNWCSSRVCSHFSVLASSGYHHDSYRCPSTEPTCLQALLQPSWEDYGGGHRHAINWPGPFSLQGFCHHDYEGSSSTVPKGDGRGSFPKNY